MLINYYIPKTFTACFFTINMACMGFVSILFLLILSKLSRCSTDCEDSFSCDVKDDIKFGVANSSDGVSSSVLALFCFINKHVYFRKVVVNF